MLGFVGWLLLWLPLCAYFLLPKVGLLGTLLLVDRLIPSFDLLRRNTWALLTRQPLSAALDKPLRLATYDRYTLFALAVAAYRALLLALHAERQPLVELALCAVALPPLQPRALARLGALLAWRDGRVRRLAAKLVVRAIKALSVALLGQPALVHSADVLPFVDQAPELLWQICKHGSLTLLLLYVKRYSQRSYYWLLRTVYYYQTAQLRRRPSATQARRKLVALLDQQRWGAFALDGKTFGLVMVLFHQGEPDVPLWITSVNFAAARLVAVWTLAQGLHAAAPRWAPLACAAALLLVQRAELDAYWRTCGAAALGAAAIALDAPLWLGAALATSRPLWFGAGSLVKLLLKRLRYAAALQLPAYWLLCAGVLAQGTALANDSPWLGTLQLGSPWLGSPWLGSPWLGTLQLGALPIHALGALPLLLYALTLPWHAAVGALALVLLGWRSAYAAAHLLPCALCASALYTVVAYSRREPTAPQPKISPPLRFRMIENYKAT